MAFYKKRKISFVLVFLSFLYLNCGLSEKEMETMYEKGTALFVANQRNEALKIFQELYEEDEDYKDVKLLIGKLLYYDRKFQQAEEVFQEISDKDPANYNALGWLIKAQFASTPLKKELTENLQNFLSKDTENAEILFISGRLLEETGKPDQAILAYKKIISQTGILALSHRQLEILYRNARLEKKASYHNKKYLELIGKSDSSKE
ncbi:tetratricopeptide repeat protein [Leptospira sp. 201903071]|uniref:tetratricopeptide repeat protein n=1 Tax=Leptospira ainazelensis TaxID=2810034 RepID=UPI001963ADD9|nr:tetratricopeptide repeat protein [Leptospira ainazelensis]MBM9498967.1 tetratricopeptide repeat protein [Leptospira ainazelensis]